MFTIVNLVVLPGHFRMNLYAFVNYCNPIFVFAYTFYGIS